MTLRLLAAPINFARRLLASLRAALGRYRAEVERQRRDLEAMTLKGRPGTQLESRSVAEQLAFGEGWRAGIVHALEVLNVADTIDVARTELAARLGRPGTKL